MTDTTQSAFVAAFVSTAVYVSVLTPFDVLKNAQMVAVRKTSTGQVLKQIVKHSGVRGLWRGLSPSLASTGLNNLIYFPLYETLKPTFSEYTHTLGPGLAAITSRLAAACVAAPIESFRTSVQANGEALFKLSFNGIRATLLRDVCFSGVLFTVLDNAQERLKVLGEWQARIVSILLGSSCAVLLTQPLDVLKTRLQARKCCYSAYERNLKDALGAIIAREGYAGLASGFFPRACKLVPGILLYLSIYESSKSLICND